MIELEHLLEHLLEHKDPECEQCKQEWEAFLPVVQELARIFREVIFPAITNCIVSLNQAMANAQLQLVRQRTPSLSGSVSRSTIGSINISSDAHVMTFNAEVDKEITLWNEMLHTPRRLPH